MQEVILDQPKDQPKAPKAIDDFFKAYVIFYGLILLISFLLSLLNAPYNSLIKLFFNAVLLFVLAFHIVYFILLIAKKKGIGRILVHLVNSFSMLVIAIGFIFYFARWEFGLEMLTVSLVTIPFLFVQVVYELVVREDKSKALNIISFGGISVFSIGILFVLQKWPSGMQLLIAGGLITFIMLVVHFNLAIKKEAQYQIHIRYMTQCLFAILAAIMLFVCQ